MNTTNFLEFLGYIASLIVLISLLMSSIIKLRWINLIGSAVFSTYGFLIGAFPVGFMNLCICIINIYYLYKIYSTKESFKILFLEDNSQYFNYFMDYYKKDITKYNGSSNFSSIDNSVSFYILRNLVPAGVFIASKHDSKTLKIELDFVIPEYRDFKVGSFIYDNSKEYFLEKGYSRFICHSSSDMHIKYLKKMGFKEGSENGDNFFVKQIS